MTKADLDNLPSPDELANDIIENLQSALDSFKELQAQLKNRIKILPSSAERGKSFALKSLI